MSFHQDFIHKTESKLSGKFSPICIHTGIILFSRKIESANQAVCISLQANASKKGTKPSLHSSADAKQLGRLGSQALVGYQF